MSGNGGATLEAPAKQIRFKPKKEPSTPFPAAPPPPPPADLDDDVANYVIMDDHDKRKIRSGSGSGSGAVKKPVLVAAGRCCQAERCAADLTEAKLYHRRHKVCELHAKAQAVIVAGIPQRFCQQCSRFHEVSEFDDTKRSCRRRLAGHNERRRKSTVETQLADGSSGSRGGGGGGGQGSDGCGQMDDHQRGRIQYQDNSSNCTGVYKYFQIR